MSPFFFMNTENRKSKDEETRDLLKALMFKAIKAGAEQFPTMDFKRQQEFRTVLDNMIIDLGAKIADIECDRQVAIEAMLKIEGYDNGTNT